MEENGAGDFDEGVIFVPIMHTLNWTNSLNEQKHVVTPGHFPLVVKLLVLLFLHRASWHRAFILYNLQISVSFIKMVIYLLPPIILL